jgi:hypothetical protein
VTGLPDQDAPRVMAAESEELSDALRTQVLFAREYLRDVRIGAKQAGIPVVHFLVWTIARAHHDACLAARALPLPPSPPLLQAGSFLLSHMSEARSMLSTTNISTKRS